MSNPVNTISSSQPFQSRTLPTNLSNTQKSSPTEYLQLADLSLRTLMPGTSNFLNATSSLLQNEQDVELQRLQKEAQGEMVKANQNSMMHQQIIQIWNAVTKLANTLAGIGNNQNGAQGGQGGGGGQGQGQ